MELHRFISQEYSWQLGTTKPVIARLGVADVRAFGLAWEDCEELLHELGFSPRVEVVAV